MVVVVNKSRESEREWVRGKREVNMEERVEHVDLLWRMDPLPWISLQGPPM